ncbi:MAG: hypothetical protein ABFR82_02870 [Nitrospirota bacterium]
MSAVTFSDEKGSEGFDLEFLSSTNGIVQMGAAFLTNLFLHEFGHEVVANYVGATGARLDFFKREDEQFFLGTSSVEKIDENSMLPYAMGGEFFAENIIIPFELDKYISLLAGNKKQIDLE